MIDIDCKTASIWRPRIGRGAAAGLLCILLAVAGCSFHKSHLQLSMAHPLARSAQPSSAKVKPQYSPPSELEMMIINLPRGKFTKNRAIWKLLSPFNSPAAKARELKENGFRVGSAPFTTWGQVYQILRHTKGLISQRTYIEVAGLQAVLINARLNIRRELLAYRTPGRHLVLRTYRDCDNIFLLTAVKSRKQNRTILDIVPAVNLGTVKFSRGPHALGVVQGIEPAEHVFRNLIFSIPLPPRHFLVVAPLHSQRNPNRIGPEFLTDGRKVPPRETIFIFAPLHSLK